MKATSLILSAGLITMLGAASHAPASAFHFALSRSMPAADATVSSPPEVRLWFTEAAEPNSVGIRLIDVGGDAIETGETTRDPDDARVYSIAVGRALTAGQYTVSWRGIGDDGHVVRGDYTFMVSAE